MAIYQLGAKKPQIGKHVFVAEGAVVVGDVVLGDEVNVWFSSTIRGDSSSIVVGARTNVQDGSVLHVDDNAPLNIGVGVTLGHQVMVHGCTIGDFSLIGIQAVILNRVVIGKESLVGAGSLITEGKEFPPRSLILGRPAKVVRSLTDAEVAALHASAQHYVENARAYLEQLQRLPG